MRRLFDILATLTILIVAAAIALVLTGGEERQVQAVEASAPTPTIEPQQTGCEVGVESLPALSVPSTGTARVLEQIDGFEFRVDYNPDKVCVNIEPALAWHGLIEVGQAVCITTGLDQPTGAAGISCTILPGAVPLGNIGGKHLADVTVTPRDLIDQLREQGCELVTVPDDPKLAFFCNLQE